MSGAHTLLWGWEHRVWVGGSRSEAGQGIAALPSVLTACVSFPCLSPHPSVGSQGALCSQTAGRGSRGSRGRVPRAGPPWRPPQAGTREQRVPRP